MSHRKPALGPFRGFISTTLAAILFCQGMIPSTVSAALPAPAHALVRQNYDPNGNVVRRIDANGAETLFAYDAINHLIAIDYPAGDSPDVSFSYDANGNRTEIADWTGTTAYEYDLFDRLTGINYPNGNFVAYTYDNVGNITDLKHGNDNTLATQGTVTHVRYAYDPDNRIARVENVVSGETTTYDYDAAGNPARRVLPNGVVTVYSYDNDGRLVSVSHRNRNGDLICQYNYTLNAIGNRILAVESTPEGDRTTTYTYDALDRIDTVTYPDGRFVAYEYDSFGNRTRMTERIDGEKKVTTYVYDTDSRLLSTTLNDEPEESFVHDQIGNLIQRYRLTDRRLIDYVYDTENRLVRYYDGTNNVEYVYNGIGERVARIVNGERTDFLNDPNRRYVQVLAETDETGTPKRVYDWGNELLCQKAAHSNYYYLHDAIMGNVRRIIRADSEIVNSYDCDAFGELRRSLETISNSYRFHSEVDEIATGLSFHRARYSDSHLGRFLTRDSNPGTLRFPLSMNPYLFINNDPINQVDPGGDTPLHAAFGAGVAISAGIGGALSAWSSGWKGWGDGHRGWSLVADISKGFGSGVLGTIGKVPGLGETIKQATDFYSSPIDTWHSFHYDTDKILGSALFDIAFKSVGKLTGISERIKQFVSDQLRVSYSLNNGVINPAGWIDHSGRIDLFGTLADKATKGLLKQAFGLFRSSQPGGVALTRSAEVLLDISKVDGATYDPATGQILLFGRADDSPTALPPMNLDDLAVAFRAISKGTMPVVRIEDPVVASPPGWPGRDAFTVRYGPFITDPLDGKDKVLDVSSKTHSGWVMFEADRLMKCLNLGTDNRTAASVTSQVPGYLDAIDLSFKFENQLPERIQTRFWFNPKQIVIEPTADGLSMELKKAEMQLSTETMFASNGQVESTPDAEYFSRWFTENYDAIANEQVTYDDAGNPHFIFKELKQLAALVGIVKWAQINQIPMDWAFLENYTPRYFDSAPSHTPRISVTGTRGSIHLTRSWTVSGGVNYCNDLDLRTGGNPNRLALAAKSSRSAETDLAWTFDQDGTDYNVTALSVDRKEKDGGLSYSAVDAIYAVDGAVPLVLGRHFDSFNVKPSLFGWGWQAQPFALEFRGERSRFNLCEREWEGYGEIYYLDRAGQSTFRYVPSGIYDRTRDPLNIANRFAPEEDILVYRYGTKEIPGLLFSDNRTLMTMRLANGALLDFDLEGRLLRTEDRNGNPIEYRYTGRRLTEIGQPGGRTIRLIYDSQRRVTRATLPEGRLMSYSYDENGDLAAAHREAPRGRRIAYTYNGDHCLAEILDENGGAAQSSTYDVYGRVSSVSQPGVATPLTTHFSLANHTTEIAGPESLAQSIRYNDQYDLETVTDGRGNTSGLDYNQFRDVIRGKGADGRVSDLFYDSRGNQIGVLHPNIPWRLAGPTMEVTSPARPRPIPWTLFKTFSTATLCAQATWCMSIPESIPSPATSW